MRRYNERYMKYAAFGALIVVVLAGVTACKRTRSQKPKSASSASVQSLEDKEAVLRSYGYLASPVQAVEYDLVVHDNGFAPSDWSIQLMAKVPATQIPLWIWHRVHVSSTVDLQFIAKLTARDPQLRVSELPDVYQREGVPGSFVAVYKKASIVAMVDSTS